MAAGLAVVGPFHIPVSDTVHKPHEGWLNEWDSSHYAASYRYPPELVVSHSSRLELHQRQNMVEIGAEDQQAFAPVAVVS